MLFLAFLCEVDYRKKYLCEDDLSLFTNFTKSNGGTDTRVNVEFNGSVLHNALMIPITFFADDLRSRVVCMVSRIIMKLRFAERDTLCQL